MFVQTYRAGDFATYPIHAGMVREGYCRFRAVKVFTTIPTEKRYAVQTPPSVDNTEIFPVADHRVSEIASLLKSLDNAAVDSGQSLTPQPIEYEDKLVQSRLGVASGLYTAMRCKHAPTSVHCLRVALGCSSWAMALGMPASYREAIEIAALLHDIGKIGVPEYILLKPGKLLPEEHVTMASHRDMTVDILSACSAHPDVLDIVRYASAWYDGSQHGVNRNGDDIPIGSRMLAIVDAFDAMTTDHVYRPARSRERALVELFSFAGTQFDPNLVRNFHDLHNQNQAQLGRTVLDHWLTAFSDGGSTISWQVLATETPGKVSESDGEESPTKTFEAKLISNMHDGVMFVDNRLHIFQWNTGAERMTGVSAEAAIGRMWKPELLEMRDESGRRIHDESCPVAKAVATGVQSIQRLNILGRQGHDVAVDVHAIPIRGKDGAMCGATVLFHDASPEASLEEKCQALHLKATKDPLTQVANRAEFDRMHRLFIDAHLESGLPCSLIIADIDFFKKVNDTYGHQAGDTAIISFASLLKDLCRTGDLVARYGGEEFVVLCTDCNNAAAARRAEEMRKRLSETKHADLGNRGFTASFGVTELQSGDTPATMLRRADRALLQAKDQGRNQVVQLGDGMNETTQKRGWWPFREKRNKAILEADLITVVPMQITVQKLRGFIADQAANITKTGDDHLRMEVTGDRTGEYRRQDDRSVAFIIDLSFNEQRLLRSNTQSFAAGEYVETHIHVIIRPQRSRDRRQAMSTDRARMILGSLKSYLMAKDATDVSRNEPTAIDC